jgi:N-formylglutamate amidohydrolase
MELRPLDIITKGTPTTPVIAHVPHGSTLIPANERRSITLSDSDLERELLLMTDRYTPEIFEGIAELGGLGLVNNYSRLVVDPERFEEDEEEIMASRGMGAVYTKTSYQEILRKDLSAEEKKKLLSLYFRPYHEAVSIEVENMLHQFGRCLIIDCHSFPSKPLPYELNQDSDRPDICIGTDSFHTPEELTTLVRSVCEANGLRVSIDKPFAGTYVPLTYLNKDDRVSSIMIEVNRSLYMNETTGDRSSRFSPTKEIIADLLRVAANYEVTAGSHVNYPLT